MVSSSQAFDNREGPKVRLRKDYTNLRRRIFARRRQVRSEMELHMTSDEMGLREQVASLRLDMKRQRWVNAGLLIVGMVAASAVTAQTQTNNQPRELVCSSLRVVGENGRDAVLIGSDKTGGAIFAMGKDGNKQVAILADDGGGGITVNSVDEKPGVVLGSTKGDGLVSILGKNGNQQIVMSGDDDGGGMTVNAADGKERVVIFGDKKTGAVVVFDGQGKARGSIPASAATERD
jgi:hypothetical protein